MSEQVTNANEQQILAAKGELSERELEKVSGGCCSGKHFSFVSGGAFDKASPLFFSQLGGERLNPQPLPPG